MRVRSKLSISGVHLSFFHFATHRASLQRVNIQKAKELFKDYADKSLPDWVKVEEQKENEFRLKIQKIGTSEIDFKLEERKCETTGEDLVDVIETDRNIAFAHRLKAKEIEGRIDEISQKVQQHIDSNAQ